MALREAFAKRVSGDFRQVTDNLQPVTVDGTSVKSCLRRAVTTKEMAASGSKFLTSDTVFHLDVSQHPTRPKLGAQIVDADATWTVISVQWQTLVKRWRCISRELSIGLDANGATFKVTIQVATYAKGDTGAQEPTFATEEANVVAKVEIDSEAVETEHGNRTSRQTATVFFETDRTLTAKNRILGPNGEVLKVLQWTGFDDVNQLFACKCEVSKWPQS